MIKRIVGFSISDLDGVLVKSPYYLVNMEEVYYMENIK